MIEIIINTLGFIGGFLLLFIIMQRIYQNTCSTDLIITPGMIYKHKVSGACVRVDRISYGWVYYFISNSDCEYSMEESQFHKAFTDQ